MSASVWQCADCHYPTQPAFEAAVEHVAESHYSAYHPAVVEVLVVNSHTVLFRGRKVEHP